MQIILTHENADFDAIASLLGAHKLFPQAQPVLPHRVNRNVMAFLGLYGADLPFTKPELLPRGRHVRRVILVDTQTLTSVRGLSDDLEEVFILDHHTPPTELPPNWYFQGEQLGANATLLTEALSTRLIPLNRIEATLLLAGIYEDTGGLTYLGTTSRDMRAAAWLLDQGGNLEIVSEFLHHPLSPGQQVLYEVLLEHSETLEIDGHPVLISWAETSPGFDEEISTLAHKLRDLLDPSATFVLVGVQENTQIVARSKTDDINVSAVAQHFGGRGHSRAAAALVRDRSVHAVLAELQELLPYFITPRISVRELMSHGVRTVKPDTSITLVAKKMLHTGHEGFPVVDDNGYVAGLVTRNAVDRALQHKWDRQPVRRIMEPGNITVSPEDSIERVRSLMIQTGWGQIPVTQGNYIIGVVTRTDLIRLPPTEPETQRQEIAEQMTQAFPAPLLDLIHRIGEQAAQQGYTIYFVGGIVRDLMLGKPIFDVDLVVEGDAIQLAQRLTHKYGGEVRTHRRFGTAKWILPGDIGAEQHQIDRPITPNGKLNNLPEFIDLVTARTEFYERPTALPTVEWSSIKQDLHRRDFTINTMAVRLDPQRWGELLDFFGGKADLQNGVLRVLHSLSFIDDPTRILRAARFEARLGFKLDPRSEDLIAEALPLLARVTGGRIRHELDLILEEERPENALQRLQELNALEQIDPALICDDWLHQKFDIIHDTLTRSFQALDNSQVHLVKWNVWLYRLENLELHRITEKLLMPSQYLDTFLSTNDLKNNLTTLEKTEQPSKIVTLLEQYPAGSLITSWVATENQDIRYRIERYWERWRHIQPKLTGTELQTMGIKPGPIYREILWALRAAYLDGNIETLEDEKTLVYRLTQDNTEG